MGLNYRICHEGDVERLAVFHQEACGAASEPEFWRWKYFQNPSGDAIFYLGMDGDRIVGRIGEVQIRMKVGGKEVIAAQGMDIDIFEGFRGGRLLLRLHTLARQKSEENGTVFDFAFSNDFATKVFSTERIGFSIAAPVRKWVKVLDPTPYLDRILKLPVVAKPVGGAIRSVTAWKNARRVSKIAAISEIRSFDERFDQLWEEAVKGEVMLVKDSAYLNWRYLRCPAVDYKVLALERGKHVKGFIVLQLLRREGILYGNIVDILIARENENGIGDLLTATMDYFLKTGVHTIVCWFPRGSFLEPFFVRRGFRMRNIPSFLIVRTFKEDEVSLDVLKDEKNWYYTMGDTDHQLTPRVGA